MEQEKLHKQIAQTKALALTAAIISLMTLVLTFYFGNKIFMKLPKPTSVPTLAMRELVFTEQMQDDMFTRQKYVELKFEWVATRRNDTTELSLVAVGGYMDNGRLAWDDAHKVPLQQGGRLYYGDATRYNYDSPIYFSLEDMKMLHKIDGEGPLDPQDIASSITMIPFTDSDATRRYCVYYGGSTSYDSRIANPAPPFTSVGEALR